jgi:hypothetical protein
VPRVAVETLEADVAEQTPSAKETVTPSGCWSRPATALPYSTAPPRSASRSRRTCSTRHVDPLTDAAFAELPPGTPLLVGLRLALRTAFARLEPEKRALEKVRMELVRTVPELAAAVRERGGMSVDAVATAIGEGFGLDPGSLDVQLFAGVVAGARLAAQSLVAREPGRDYVDTLDAVLERLEGGIPIADLPLPAGGRAKFRG